MKHEPVLISEVIHFLEISERKMIIDATVGLGGHSEKILESDSSVKVLGLDHDQTHLSFAKKRLEKFSDRFEARHLTFAHVEDISVMFDGILFDLGVASPHFDEASRGFSFEHEGPLDMRMDQGLSMTARELIRKSSVEKLKKIFSEYGEERESGRLARALAGQDISTTTELAVQVANIKKIHSYHHPATQIFQALRIAVNDELAALQKGLSSALDHIAPKGRILVISYHSLEDRIVKQTFRLAANPCTCPPKVPICICQKKPLIRILTKKPVMASKEEIARNPRARSAKMRVAERI